MKKLSLVLSILAASVLTTVSAQAHESLRAPELSAATCYIDGDLSGVGISFIFGGQMIGGKGEITCLDSRNRILEQVPVRIQFLSAGVGFDFSVIRSVTIQSTGIRLSNGAADLVGSFSVGVTAGANLVNQGVDFDSAIQVSREPGVSLVVGLKGKNAVGLGARLHATTMLVSPR